mgnify:CR=1 FL=1
MALGPALYLGSVGSTGLSTGPHAHWEVMKDGKRFPLSQARSDIGQYIQFLKPGEKDWQTLYLKQGDGFTLNPAAVLTSPMGMRQHPLLSEQRLHGGEDYGLPQRTQLRFLGPGAVSTFAGKGGAGNVSTLRTGPYELSTFHLSKLPDSAIIKGTPTESQVAVQQTGTDAETFLKGMLVGMGYGQQPQETTEDKIKRQLMGELLAPSQSSSQAFLDQFLSSNPFLNNPYLA